jgi:hypothetical protein
VIRADDLVPEAYRATPDPILGTHYEQFVNRATLVFNSTYETERAAGQETWQAEAAAFRAMTALLSAMIDNLVASRGAA